MNKNTLSCDYATSSDVNIVVKLTYFRFDRLRSTKTHINYNHHGHRENRNDLKHSWFLNDDLEGHWDMF